MRYPDRLLSQLVVAAAAVSLAWGAAGAARADDAKTLANFDSLIAGGRFEEADAVIRQDMPFLEDRAAGYLRLAKVEAYRFNRQRAFQAFAKALAAAKPPAEDESEDASLAPRLRSVRLLRMYGAFDVAEAFLDRLEKSRGISSSLLYEQSYLANSRDDTPAYFDTFYAAYRLNPKNTLATLGLATIHREASDESAVEMTARWAESAAVIGDYYDSFSPWTAVVQGLDAGGILRDDAKYTQFAACLDETPRLVLDALRATALKHKGDAKRAVQALATPAQSDLRADLLRRRLLASTGSAEAALAGLGDPPRDMDLRLAYLGFLLDMCNELRADARRAADAACSFIEAVGALGETEGFGPGETGLIRAGLAESISDSLADDGQVDAARLVLERSATGGVSRANIAATLAEVGEKFPVHRAVFAANCKALETMYIHADRYAEAIGAMESELASTSGAGREAVLARIVDFAALTGDSAAVERALSFARDNGLAGFVEKYGGIQEKLQDPRLARRLIRGVAGVRTRWNKPIWEPQGFGPCIVNSTRIVHDFWGRKVRQEEVVEGLAKARTTTQGSHGFIVEYFKSAGLDIQYFAPSIQTARAVLDRDVPIFLLHQRTVGGYSGGHVSVVFGYDDRVGKVFLRESDGAGEARIAYDDLCECDAIVVIGPAVRVDQARSDAAAYKTDTPPKPLSEDDIKALSGLDGTLEYWACWTNGTLSGESDHMNDFISWTERARRVRRPQTSVLDERLVHVLLAKGDSEKAMKYVLDGLEIDPASLALSYCYALIKGKLYEGSRVRIEPALADELIAVTAKMESTDPAYPETYYLRGRIALASGRKELALTSFQRYLNRYRKTGKEYKQENLSTYREISGQVSTLRRELLENALFDGTAATN
jgi:tetratricopeptide (TPR) repeat protein